MEVNTHIAASSVCILPGLHGMLLRADHLDDPIFDSHLDVLHSQQLLL